MPQRSSLLPYRVCDPFRRKDGRLQAVQRCKFITQLGGTAAWHSRTRFLIQALVARQAKGVQRTSCNAVKLMMRPMEIGSSLS
jgi:hypothetical protein